MSSFTKTKIVDCDGGGDFSTIREATDYFINNNIGGVIYVESGVYEIDGTNINGDKRTVIVPSNTTIIGRGNVEVRVTQPGTEEEPIQAFTNSDWQDGNERITISGFKNNCCQ